MHVGNKGGCTRSKIVLAFSKPEYFLSYDF